MYALVRFAGRQFRVEEGQTFSVSGLSLEPGTSIDLEVLATADGGELKVGTPALAGSAVTAEVVGVRKGEKVEVLRYKSKVRHRKSRGHRAPVTDLRVTKIAPP